MQVEREAEVSRQSQLEDCLTEAPVSLAALPDSFVLQGVPPDPWGELGFWWESRAS